MLAEKTPGENQAFLLVKKAFGNQITSLRVDDIGECGTTQGVEGLINKPVYNGYWLSILWSFFGASEYIR
jgi:hypothetical protein